MIHEDETEPELPQYESNLIKRKLERISLVRFQRSKLQDILKFTFIYVNAETIFKRSRFLSGKQKLCFRTCGSLSDQQVKPTDRQKLCFVRALCHGVVD